jgi:hypothetical protein
VDETPTVDRSRAIWEHLTFHLDGFVLDELTLINSRLLSYLAKVTSLLERRPIGREELLQLLCGSLRRRSMGRLPRREYVLRYLHEHPP